MLARKQVGTRCCKMANNITEGGLVYRGPYRQRYAFTSDAGTRSCRRTSRCDTLFNHHVVCLTLSTPLHATEMLTPRMTSAGSAVLGTCQTLHCAELAQYRGYVLCNAGSLNKPCFLEFQKHVAYRTYYCYPNRTHEDDITTVQ